MRLEAFSVGGRGEGGGRPDEIILAAGNIYLIGLGFECSIIGNVDKHLTPPGFALSRPILSRRLF